MGKLLVHLTHGPEAPELVELTFEADRVLTY